jgi:hypothetical protein
MATKTSVLKMQVGTAILADDKDKVFPIPLELFRAFEHFFNDPKPSGTVTVSFKNGGIAGVETNTRQILK